MMAFGDNFMMSKEERSQAELENLRQENERLKRVFEDKALDQESNVIASDSYYEIAEILQVPEFASVIESVQRLQDDYRKLEDAFNKMANGNIDLLTALRNYKRGHEDLNYAFLNGKEIGLRKALFDALEVYDDKA